MARKVIYKKFLEYAETVDDQDFQKFAGPATKNFEKTRQAMLAGEATMDIPLWGFLFFPFYSAYHKQWALALAFVSIIYGMDFFLEKGVSLGMTAGMSISMAGFFKRVYVENAYKKISELKKGPLDAQQLENEIIKQGRTIWWGPFVILAVMCMYVFIVINFK